MPTVSHVPVFTGADSIDTSTGGHFDGALRICLTLETQQGSYKKEKPCKDIIVL